MQIYIIAVLEQRAEISGESVERYVFPKSVDVLES